NPVTDRFTLQLNSDYTGVVKAVLSDMKGSIVKTFVLNKGIKGSYNAYLSLQGLPQGIYTLTTVQNTQQTKAIQIIKK
ncbi:MAG: T9SS type A sorting domain-containing protein, partial [Chitinophagaceae bacterium]